MDYVAIKVKRKKGIRASIRETKRALNDWKGWRVDVVDIRVGMGGVFEI